MIEIFLRKGLKGLWETRTCEVIFQPPLTPAAVIPSGDEGADWGPQREGPHRQQLLQAGSPASQQITAFPCCIKITLISMPNSFLLHTCSIFPKFPICFPLTWLNVNPFPLQNHRRFTGSTFSRALWLWEIGWGHIFDSKVKGAHPVCVFMTQGAYLRKTNKQTKNTCHTGQAQSCAKG